MSAANSSSNCKDYWGIEFIVNIPIPSDDVLQTVTSLPRTPTEAGIIPVKLKRKLAYKNVHNIEYISPSNIVNALKELKKHGHKYYMDIEDVDFVKKCKFLIAT